MFPPPLESDVLDFWQQEMILAGTTAQETPFLLKGD